MSKHPRNKTIRPRRVTQMPVPVQHAPQAPQKPAARTVGLQRIADALARLKAGWLPVFDVAKGWRLRLGQRTVKVRRDVLLAVAALVVKAKGRTVTA